MPNKNKHKPNIKKIVDMVPFPIGTLHANPEKSQPAINDIAEINPLFFINYFVKLLSILLKKPLKSKSSFNPIRTITKSLDGMIATIWP